MQLKGMFFSKVVLILMQTLISNATLTYEDIARNIPKAWENPSIMSQVSVALPPPTPDFVQYDERISERIASDVLNFAQKMGSQLSAQTASDAHRAKSVVFSPISIMSALALLMLGARGKSYHELQQLFRIQDDNFEVDEERLPMIAETAIKFHIEFGYLLEDLQRSTVNSQGRKRSNANWRQTVASNNIRGYEKENPNTTEHIITVATGIFAQDGYNLSSDYLNASQNVYRAALTSLDFANKPNQARDYINSWIDRNTNGKILKIINDEVRRDTKVILANTLYFKGFWENSFFASATVEDYFYPNGINKQPIEVPMMATGGVFPFYKSVEYDCRIIGLPYNGNLTTMYIIQPNDSSRSKLKDLQMALNATKIEELISKMVRKSAMLVLPKMHLVRSIHLRDTLNRLGVGNIFQEGISDLSLIGVEADDEVLSPNNDVLRTSTTHAPLPTNGANVAAKFVPMDRFNEPALIFARSSISNVHITESNETSHANFKSKSFKCNDEPRNSDWKTNILCNLEWKRLSSFSRSDLFVQDILHKVDIEINEEGTEAAAATITYLRRSGTDVSFRADTPFLFLIRHDVTKLVLFYGIINEPN